MQSEIQSNKDLDIEGRRFDKTSVNNLLSAIEKNRRLAPGFNNFRPYDEVPINGNPYPEQRLAGKYMQDENTGTM